MNLKKTILNLPNKINIYLDKKYPSFESLFVDGNENNKNGIYRNGKNVGKFVKKDKNVLNRVLFKIIVSAISFSIILFFVNISIVFFTDKGGVFGDFFGGVLNPILTFFTLFGLIVTIVIQRQELKLSRYEYEKTADALGIQAIENTLFNILDLHHKIVDNLKVDLLEISNKNDLSYVIIEFKRDGVMSPFPSIDKNVDGQFKNTKFEGRAVFEEILEFISYNTKSPDEVLHRYKIIQTHHNHILGHYFRNLYQALKIIDGYHEDIQKRKYSSILRAQLSTKELALLFLNCIEGVCDEGQFKNLLIKYEMLEHLPIVPKNGIYVLTGSNIPLATEAMIFQYKKRKNLRKKYNKYYGGAFGKSTGIQLDLNAGDKTPSMTYSHPV